MTAQELDTMVKNMRTKYYSINSRSDLCEQINHLNYGLKSIGKLELAQELRNLYHEIEEVDTLEIMWLGTFEEE